MNRICVLGLGYVGLPTASLFANNGFEVTGVDSNPKVVEAINSGKIHIDEVGLRTLVEAAVRSGRLKASPVPAAADTFIICVPTPIDADRKPDLSHVFAAAGSIVPLLRPGNLVIVESTVPPRTTERVASFVAGKRQDLAGDRTKPLAALPVFFAHCPERVLPGKILKELVENDRVIGGLNAEATRLACDLYGAIVSGRVFRTDATTAEMVKLSENTYRDVNIALSNELAGICEKLGVNVWELIELANKHPRVGILNPGPGVGGHCIAVDPWFIAAEFPEEAPVIRAARLANDAVPGRVAGQVERLVRGIVHPKIACLGAAYKGNIGDVRNSPAIEIFNLLTSTLASVADISISDVHVSHSGLPLVSLEAAIDQASLIVLLTDHEEYKSLDPSHLAGKVKRKVLFDTRNHLDHASWAAAGFEVHTLGDGSKEAPGA